LLDMLQHIIGWQTKMEANHPRPHLKHQTKSLFVKTRKRIGWLWHGTKAELVVIGSKTCSDPVRSMRINVWSRVHEKVQVERAIGGSTYLFNLVPRGLRRQRCTTERAERARVGDGGNQRRAAKAAHRRL